MTDPQDQIARDAFVLMLNAWDSMEHPVDDCYDEQVNYFLKDFANRHGVTVITDGGGWIIGIRD